MAVIITRCKIDSIINPGTGIAIEVVRSDHLIAAGNGRCDAAVIIAVEPASGLIGLAIGEYPLGIKAIARAAGSPL